MNFLKFFSMLFFLLTITACVKQNDVVCKTYTYKYDIPLSKEDWISRGSNGEVTTLMENGVKISEHYQGGLLNGKTTYTFPYSEVIEIAEVYDMGNLIVRTINYDNGQPKQEEKYVSKTNIVVTTWYNSGSPKSIETYNTDLLVDGKYFNIVNEEESQVVDGKGIRINRNNNDGALISKDNIDSYQITTQTTYYDNKDPQSITTYKNGIINGKKQFFLIGGIPQRTENWKNGVQHGITTTYKNGEKHMEIPYVNGEISGLVRTFRNNNILVEATNWNKGLQHGASHTYLNGIANTNWYYKGKLVSKAIYNKLIKMH